MSRRRRGSLTPEERALWRAAMRGAVPLRREPPAGEPGDTPRPRAGPPAAADTPKPPAPPPAPRVSVGPAPPPLEPAGATAPGIDRRTFLRLKRGELRPQARIDLHGLSADRAHPALECFVGDALARGLRLLLVITGKGGARTGPRPDDPFLLPPPGLLRRKAPVWLRAGPYGREIAGMWPAHPRHGGSGAFYVYLKRRR